MADSQYIIVDTQNQQARPIRLIDNGDGTYSMALSLSTALAAQIDSVAAKLATDAVMDGQTPLTPKFAPIAAASSGNNTVVAAVAGKKIRVLDYCLSFSGAVNAKFQTGAGGTDLTGLHYGAANAQVPGSFNPLGKFETAAGALLNLNLSAATAVGGYVVYVEG